MGIATAKRFETGKLAARDKPIIYALACYHLMVSTRHSSRSRILRLLLKQVRPRRSRNQLRLCGQLPEIVLRWFPSFRLADVVDFSTTRHLQHEANLTCTYSHDQNTD